MISGSKLYYFLFLSSHFVCTPQTYRDCFLWERMRKGVETGGAGAGGKELGFQQGSVPLVHSRPCWIGGIAVNLLPIMVMLTRQKNTSLHNVTSRVGIFACALLMVSITIGDDAFLLRGQISMGKTVVDK